MISWFDSYIDKSIGWLYSQFYRVYSIMIHVVWFCFALLWLTHLLLDKMSTILLDAWRCSTTHSETEGFSLLSPHTVLYSWGRWTHSMRSRCCGKAEGSQRLSLHRGLDGKVPRTLISSPFKTNVRHAPADNLPISVCNSPIPVKNNWGQCDRQDLHFQVVNTYHYNVWCQIKRRCLKCQIDLSRGHLPQ